MKTSIIITNHYLEATEPTRDDHMKCDYETLVCVGCGDPEPHLRLAAIARGEKIKSGIKISDLTFDEVKALAKDCEWQVHFTSPAHLQEDFKYARNIHYGLKRLYERLINLQKVLEETK
jgi:hypothetical protein